MVIFTDFADFVYLQNPSLRARVCSTGRYVVVLCHSLFVATLRFLSAVTQLLPAIALEALLSLHFVLPPDLMVHCHFCAFCSSCFNFTDCCVRWYAPDLHVSVVFALFSLVASLAWWIFFMPTANLFRFSLRHCRRNRFQCCSVVGAPQESQVNL